MLLKIVSWAPRHSDLPNRPLQWESWGSDGQLHHGNAFLGVFTFPFLSLFCFPLVAD